MSDVRFPFTVTSESSELFAVCHLPHQTSKETYPIVVMCHGLGGDKAGRGRASVLLSEQLAAKGIASVRFDFRGNGDSEGEFKDLTPHRCVTDLYSILGWVKGQERLDSKRLGLYGRSFGGLIALLFASQSSVCRALAVQSPIYPDALFMSQVVQGKHSHLFYDQKAGSLLFEGEMLCSQFLEQMRAISMEQVVRGVNEIPFLHISCGKDTIVDERQAKQYQKRREEASASSRFFVLKEADHSCSRYSDRQTVLQETSDWFISQLM